MRTLVIAGSYRQARDWAYRNGLKRTDYDYVIEERQLYGLDAKEVSFVLVGEWWRNPVHASERYGHMVKWGAQVRHERDTETMKVEKEV